MRSESEIVADLMQYSPQDGNWLGLEDLLAELWATGPTSYCLPALFGIFERFPTDCAGPLWSILHGVEGLEFPYDVALRESLARQESEMGLVMLYRLEKAAGVDGAELRLPW